MWGTNDPDWGVTYGGFSDDINRAGGRFSSKSWDDVTVLPSCRRKVNGGPRLQPSVILIRHRLPPWSYI